jgi:uncharacterized protein (DUF1697 family)
MRRVIVLLRGVNVSGRNKVPMAELRERLGSVGFDDVATLIQSGNIGVHTDRGLGEIVDTVADVLVEAFDVDVPVVAIERGDLQAIADRCPLPPDGNPSYQLVYFVSGPVDVTGVDALDRQRFPGDTIVPTRDAIYVEYGGGQSKTKLTLAHLEKASGVSVTGRNLKTVAKLRDL